MTAMEAIKFLLLVLDGDVLSDLLSKWLSWWDFVSLDSALCSHEMRRAFHSFLHQHDKPIRLRIRISRQLLSHPEDTFRRMDKWLLSRNVLAHHAQTSLCHISPYVQHAEHSSKHISSLQIDEVPSDNQILCSTSPLVSLFTKFPTLTALQIQPSGAIATEDMDDTFLMSALPTFRQLQSLTLHHLVIGYDAALQLANNLPNIRHLSLQNSFDCPEILTALFIDTHLVHLRSFELLNELTRAPSWAEDPLLATNGRTQEHLTHISVDPVVLYALLPLMPHLRYISNIRFDKFRKYRLGFFDRLGRSSASLTHVSLDLHLLDSNAITDCMTDIERSFLPYCTHLSYLSLQFGYEGLQKIWGFLRSLPESCTQLKTIKVHYCRTETAVMKPSLQPNTMITISQTEQFQRWNQFWDDLLRRNQYLCHVEVDSLPVDVSTLVKYGHRLSTLILKHFTSLQTTTLQSILLRSVGGFPVFPQLIRLHLEDDRITDEVVHDFFVSIGQSSESGSLRLKHLALLSNSLTKQTLQYMMYMSDAFTQQLTLLVISAEMDVGPLLQCASKRFCAPFGSLRYFTIVAEIDDMIRQRVLPHQRSASWRQALIADGIDGNAAPLFQGWRSLRQLRIVSSEKLLEKALFPFQCREDMEGFAHWQQDHAH